MDHGENIKVEEHEDLVEFKTRIGIYLFVAYGIIYTLFVLLNTVLPASMKIIVLYGMNLAVFYGFSLIILAIIMSVIYNIICTKKEKEFAAREGDKK